MNKKYFYLIEIQYLGFRYHGWQKQPNVKTVQGMVERTINYVLDGVAFKTLASGRTDGMVSANQSAFELFTKEPLDTDQFFSDFNQNLPQDIRALGIREVDEQFNIIQSAKSKEYLYLFSFGKKNHPFSAPYMTYVNDVLNIEAMKEAAKLFVGRHYFGQFCYQPNGATNLEREVELCEIVVNDEFTANFFPRTSYMLRVQGNGFMRHQIRLMMGALFRLGKGEISQADITNSLKNDGTLIEQYIAPASGLILNSVEFDCD